MAGQKLRRRHEVIIAELSLQEGVSSDLVCYRGECANLLVFCPESRLIKKLPFGLFCR